MVKDFLMYLVLHYPLSSTSSETVKTSSESKDKTIEKQSGSIEMTTEISLKECDTNSREECSDSKTIL
jgi:hypothetical protein